MASYNRVVLVGNLTKNIELRYTPGRTPVADVSIAINDRRKTNTGEWVEEVTFVDITMWGRTAEVASEYLGKGSPILVEGRLKQDTWESEGKKRSKLKVICERMQMLGGAGGGSARPPSSTSGSAAAPVSHQPAPSSGNVAESPSTEDAPTEPPTVPQQTAGGAPDYEEPDIPF